MTSVSFDDDASSNLSFTIVSNSTGRIVVSVDITYEDGTVPYGDDLFVFELVASGAGGVLPDGPLSAPRPTPDDPRARTNYEEVVYYTAILVSLT